MTLAVDSATTRRRIKSVAAIVIVDCVLVVVVTVVVDRVCLCRFFIGSVALTHSHVSCSTGTHAHTHTHTPILSVSIHSCPQPNGVFCLFVSCQGRKRRRPCRCQMIRCRIYKKNGKDYAHTHTHTHTYTHTHTHTHGASRTYLPPNGTVDVLVSRQSSRGSRVGAAPSSSLWLVGWLP